MLGLRTEKEIPDSSNKVNGDEVCRCGKGDEQVHTYKELWELMAVKWPMLFGQVAELFMH